jgi:hypothetical protein
MVNETVPITSGHDERWRHGNFAVDTIWGFPRQDESRPVDATRRALAIFINNRTMAMTLARRSTEVNFLLQQVVKSYAFYHLHCFWLSNPFRVDTHGIIFLGRCPRLR